MELKAPADGIVYYGECEDGNWSDMASMISKLKPHDTVVGRHGGDDDPRAPAARGAGASGRSTSGPISRSARRRRSCRRSKTRPGSPAKLDSISAVPVATGKFDAEFDLTGSELPDWIVAGMSCKVKVTTYDKEDALVVPKKAVHTDKDDEELKYVWLVDRKTLIRKTPTPSRSAAT